MKLKIKCWGEHKPKIMTDGSAGIDLYNNGNDVIIDPLLSKVPWWTVETKTAVEIPEGYVGLVFVRSGHGFKGLDLINSCGVIDSDYRGEIGLKFVYHCKAGMMLKAGDRVAQLVIVPYFKPTEIEYVDELTETERGANGFGSTDNLEINLKNEYIDLTDTIVDFAYAKVEEETVHTFEGDQSFLGYIISTTSKMKLSELMEIQGKKSIKVKIHNLIFNAYINGYAEFPDNIMIVKLRNVVPLINKGSLLEETKDKVYQRRLKKGGI